MRSRSEDSNTGRKSKSRGSSLSSQSSSSAAARESDPLLSNNRADTSYNRQQHHHGSIRSRRSKSNSPNTTQSYHQSAGITNSDQSLLLQQGTAGGAHSQQMNNSNRGRTADSRGQQQSLIQQQVDQQLQQNQPGDIQQQQQQQQQQQRNRRRGYSINDDNSSSGSADSTFYEVYSESLSIAQQRTQHNNTAATTGGVTTTASINAPSIRHARTVGTQDGISITSPITATFGTQNSLDTTHNYSLAQQQQQGGGLQPPSSIRRHNAQQLVTSQQQQQSQQDSITDSTTAQQPLFEIPEEIYAVRKAALKVLKPLTATWLVITVGFSLTVLLGMVRWTHLVVGVPYWIILLPSWLSHGGLLLCHIKSAKALSNFIHEANDNRQRADSTDHLDRTEYLPLLQRSLKFGLKTGLLSFCIFIFEVLIYFRIAKHSISLWIALIPIWVFVIFGIMNGIICKTQHILKVTCWILVFTSMVLAVLRVDFGIDDIRWRLVISPLLAILMISSGTLIYIVYGHQVGYYRLTEAQLTAGILYSMAALICIVLLVVVGEVIPLDRPVEIETRFFVVSMAPLIVVLVGMGAWAVSRDEFAKLLLYGGQATVHPRKLRLEPNGWNSVESKGVSMIPMFGEVSFKPLEKSSSDGIELCNCCACYPYEDDDDVAVQYPENVRWENPYLAPSTASQQTSSTGPSKGMVV